MPKKISVTLPDAITNGIANAAIDEGSRPGSLAAFLLEALVKEKFKSGEWPSEWKRSPEELATELEQNGQYQSDAEQMKALEVLKKLATKVPVSTGELAIAAAAIDIDTSELLDVVSKLGLKKNGNGTSSKTQMRS